MAVVVTAGLDGASTGTEVIMLKVAKAGSYVVQRKVVMEQANTRLGTGVAKTRSEVRGGGRKPYKQKGTGRARRGSTRSPLLVGGGKSFGPRQKSYAIRMNKKERQLALSTALMGAVPRMTLVPDFEFKFEAPKTSEMLSFIEGFDSDTSGAQTTLLVMDKRHENAYLSARNIPCLNLISLENLNACDILRAKKLVVSASAMTTLKKRYGA